MVESTGPPPSESISTQRPLLVIVEGHNDFEFILRLAARLRIELPELPDVRALCAEGQMAGELLGWFYMLQQLLASELAPPV